MNILKSYKYKLLILEYVPDKWNRMESTSKTVRNHWIIISIIHLKFKWKMTDRWGNLYKQINSKANGEEKQKFLEIKKQRGSNNPKSHSRQESLGDKLIINKNWYKALKTGIFVRCITGLKRTSQHKNSFCGIINTQNVYIK